jgi:hypothetical protein
MASKPVQHDWRAALRTGPKQAVPEEPERVAITACCCATRSSVPRFIWEGSPMSLERRQPGGLYYYRSVRVGDRVVKQYLGAGEQARRVAELVDSQRAAQANRDRGWRAEQEELDAIDRLTADLDALVNQTIHDVLTASGFHQHHRGEWRRSRSR